MSTVTTSEQELFPRIPASWRTPGSAPEGLRLRRVKPDLWRVSSERGSMLGHVRAIDAEGETRFEALRILPRDARYLPIGEYWSLDDATRSFRALG